MPRTLVKPLPIVAIIVLAGIVLAIGIPARPSPDNAGKLHVSEAVSLLRNLQRKVEAYARDNGHAPDISEMADVETAGEFVERIEGSNPYFAVMKTSGVYDGVAGKTLGWSFNLTDGSWDRCALGTVERRFKPPSCRK